MGKLKITKKQYDTILLREQESRLKSISMPIMEETKGKEPLSNGISNLVFILAKLLGKEMTGQNKVHLENALNDVTNLKRLKGMLEDSDKTKELISGLEAKGMDNPSEKLGLNAKEIIAEFNKLNPDIQLDDKALHTLLGLVHDK